MSDFDYEKLFRDIENNDSEQAATKAITPDGEIPTVRFDGTPATAKAVIASPEPQKNLNEWDRLNYVEKAWNSFWGGIHNLLKSNAVSDITEKKQAADAGLSALFGSDDMNLDDASMEKFRQAYADKTVGGKYKKQKERELEEAIGDYIDLSKKDKDYYAPTVVSAASKATEGKGFWESIPAWFAEVSKDPFDYALYIAGSSAGAIAPFLATSMAGGFALNAMKLNSVARAVQAATMGAGSYNVEFGSYIENYIAEKGYDLSNVESVKEALGKEDVAAIREKAFRRAAVVGAFDAISAWIAPIRLNPSNALRTLRRGVAEGVQDVALPASRLHRVGKGLENMTLQTTLQGVMGGAGEAFGQLVNGEKINWGEVFAEAIGEFTTAPVEVVGLAYSANANFNRETTIARNAQEINKNLQDISNVVTAVAAKLPDNGSLQQWCEAVGKDKTLFAFAQDVIDSGAIDKLKEVAPALAQQVIEAAEKKSDVNVPVSDILKLSATDEATARKLLNDVRLTADGMSPNQAEKFLKEGKKGLVDKFNQIIDNAKPDIELRKAIKVETDKIVNELVSTGTTKDVADLQVLPWASWLAVRAKQTGMKPSEIMEKVRLRIQGEQTTDGALNQRLDSIESRYNEAIAKGDMVSAEALVKEYAKTRGYTIDEDYRDWHQAPRASVAKEDFRNLDKLREAANESADVNLFAIANGVSIVPDDFFTYDGWWQYSNRNEAADSESFFKIRKAIDSIQNQIKKYGRVKHMPSVWVYRAVPKSVKEGSLQSDGQWVTPSRAYAKQHGQSRFGPGEYRIIKEPVPADSLWFNGDSINEWGFDNGEKYVYKNTTNNRKRYDAIVRDYDGNIVPLNKRFNSRKYEEFYQAKNLSASERAMVEVAARVRNLIESKPIKSSDQLDRLSGKDLVKEARRLYVEKFKMGVDKNGNNIFRSIETSDGRTVIMSSAGFNEMKQHSANPSMLRLIPVLDKIVQNGVYLDTSTPNKANRNKRDNTKYFHYYGAKLDNGTYVRFVVREMNNGAYYYDGEATREEILKGASETASSIPNGVQASSAPLARHSLAYYFAESERMSKLLDENGEPLQKHIDQSGSEVPRRTGGSPLTQRDVARALEQLGYHGSPYQFDRFTLSHIGSGEGAQAHGWGLYFALSRAVAEGYRERLKKDYLQEVEITYKGRPFSEFDEAFMEEVRKSSKEVPEVNSLEEAQRAYEESLKRSQLFSNKRALLNDLTRDAEDPKKVLDSVRRKYSKEAIDWAEKDVVPYLKKVTKGPKSALYIVEIPDDDVLLREEFSLSRQPKKVQDALRKIFEENTTFAPNAKLYREQWYKEVMEQITNYSYEFYIPTNVYSAIAKLAKEEGPQIFTDEKKVLEKISGEIDKAAKERYLTDEETKESYDEMATEDKKGIDIAREEIIEEGGLNSDGLFWTILHVTRWNYPYLLNGGYGPKFEITDSLSGYQLYKWIAKFAGGEKEASILLSKYGIKGIRYNGAQDGECAVVWDEQSIKILNALEQSMQSGPRGMYMPQNTSDTNSMSGVMTLMQTRDKSTFLHESAHVWLDADTMLAKNIAEKIKSGQEITDGEKAFLKNLGGFFRWGQSEGVIDLGVTDDISTVADAVIRWSQMTTNDQRMMHELFAEGFESYLMSGTAPNPEMRTVFGRFKKWLMDIYARATKQPRPISREVRKLYDLMFATQQQAQDTETRLGLQAMFKAADAKKLGMTDAEVQAYEELQEQATLETEGLVAKMVRGTMRIFGRARQDEIARIEKDKEAIAKKEAELLEEPRYRAVAMLNARQTVLDIRQMQGYDTDTIDALDAKGWISHDGGVSPDVLASMAGTTDAVGLIGDILDIDTVGDAHDEALRILAFEERKEFGDEGVFDELRANLAAYNDTRSRLLTAEYNAIARMLGNQQILRSAAREYAIEQIGNTKMSDLHPYTFVQAEQRCAREAEEALRKGDYAACLEAKRGQVLNHELARAALEAQERMDKGIRAVRRAMKSKTIHPQYKQLIAALVNAHAISNMTKAEREEFAKVEGMPPEKVTEFLAKLEENGTPVDGVAEFLQTHEHVQDMTAYTAEDFFGVVKQVATLGRNVLNQSLTEIAESVKEVVALGKEKLNEAADVQGRKVLKNQRSPMTRKERALNSVAQFLLGNVKIQSWCRIFDRNKDGGFFWNLFIRSANEHANFEAEQRARCSQVLREKLLPAFKKSVDEDPITIPGFDRPFTHGMRLAVALNLGNESNKQRLITNDPRFTTEALQAIMDSLTEADWRAVEAVWQLFESFKTAIGEKEMRVYGVEPEWIKYEPFKVTTKEGKTITVSGGYYPVKYDPVASNKVDKRTDAEATEQDLRGAYQSATTRRSFTQSRVTGDVTDMPLRLDLTALYEGLNDVIHDLAWHEWLIDTKRVLDGAGGPDSGLRAAIKERYGYNVAKEFEEWRKDIALGGRSEGKNDLQSLIAKTVGMSTMGFSFNSALVQLTGIGYVIPRVGAAAFSVALGKYLTSPFKTRRFVNSQSQAMLLRAQTQFKELAQIRNRLDQGKGIIQWVQENAYVLITIVQGIVDTLCWQAAYERFTREGYEGKELVALCDQTVEDTQASGNISSQSRFERNPHNRIWTVFYSWMNAALNLSVSTFYGEENKFKKVAALLWMNAVMPVIEQTWRDSLKPSDDDDDDDDDGLQWMREDLGTIVEYNLGLLPLVREFSMAAESVIKQEPVMGYSGPAGARPITNAINLAQKAMNPNMNNMTKAIIDFAGSLSGLPSTQINNTVKGIRAINSGQAEGVDAIKAPFFGFKGKIDD